MLSRVNNNQQHLHLTLGYNAHSSSVSRVPIITTVNCYSEPYLANLYTGSLSSVICSKKSHLAHICYYVPSNLMQQTMFQNQFERMNIKGCIFYHLICELWI